MRFPANEKIVEESSQNDSRYRCFLSVEPLERTRFNTAPVSGDLLFVYGGELREAYVANGKNWVPLAWDVDAGVSVRHPVRMEYSLCPSPSGGFPGWKNGQPVEARWKEARGNALAVLADILSHWKSVGLFGNDTSALVGDTGDGSADQSVAPPTRARAKAASGTTGAKTSIAAAAPAPAAKGRSRSSAGEANKRPAGQRLKDLAQTARGSVGGGDEEGEEEAEGEAEEGEEGGGDDDGEEGGQGGVGPSGGAHGRVHGRKRRRVESGGGGQYMERAAALVREIMRVDPPRGPKITFALEDFMKLAEKHRIHTAGMVGSQGSVGGRS
ncbi:hypothetical protein BV25DRAFT_1839026 [Artomyces pyxidatus]|uniref:Uncharacterized protein n=1 Tax=Artomyces pyxidatus TaxID=48021 RepID=A0ACB8SY99_9AGAM|nr:hypothetical protein BV25DRAFT_1839026 [Artomyces pyxidatus]